MGKKFFTFSTEGSQDPSNSPFAKLAELSTIHVRHRRSHTICPKDAVYDWVVGKDFVILDTYLEGHTPLRKGMVVSSGDINTFHRFNVDRVVIHYNMGCPDETVEVKI